MTLPPGKSAVLLFDGDCPLCQRSVAILKKLDWFKKIHYQNARLTDELPQTDPPLRPQQLLEEMHLVPRRGHPIYRGFGAFRWMAWRLPALWPLAPILYIPGIPWLGRRAYRWIARNRFKLVPCRDDACGLPAAKET
jgi:predicted DCC family thiol-disulfide oxidoreductase YuxK